MRVLRGAATALFLTACLLPSIARAEDPDPTARAKALFEEGKRWLGNKQYDKACPILAESLRLTAATGPLLALAMCHEGQGKTASAWSEYSEVAAHTRLEGRPDWAEKAAKAAALLEPKLARVRIVLDAGARSISDLVVKRDAQPVSLGALGMPVPVDPGYHVVEAEAPGRRPWSRQLLAAPGTTLTIAVPPPEAPASPSASGSGRGPMLRTLGITTGVVGVAALGLGAYFGVQALRDNDASKGDCVADACGASGKQSRLDAISNANVATGAFIAGGALLVGGATLFAIGRAGASAPTVTASALGSPRFAGLMLRGTF